MKKISGLTVDPSINFEGKNIDYIEIPVYSNEPNENGEYLIIDYIRETV